MPNFGFWEGNSNGRALVSVFLSNGTNWLNISTGVNHW